MTVQQNASRIKDVRKAEKSAQRYETERVEGLRHLTSTYGGRLWLSREMEEANVFSSTSTGEALSSAFNEGTRARGLAMLADLMLHLPDMFLKMMVEHNDRTSTSADLPDRNAVAATGGHPVGAGEPGRSADESELPFAADYDPTGGAALN